MAQGNNIKNAQGNNIKNIYSGDWKIELEVDARKMQDLVAECYQLTKEIWVAIGNGKQSLSSEIATRLLDRTERLMRICACA